MNFLERYNNGETKAVYDDIAALGARAFEKEYYEDILAVLHETFRRVNYNLDIIFMELVEVGYNFNSRPKHSFEHALLKPLPGAESLLQKLQQKIKNSGYVPLSLQVFYLVVGSCNFCWNYKTIPNIPWEGADPIEIAPLDTMLESVDDFEEDDEIEGLDIAADYLHKDNISGAGPYTIALTPEPSVDSDFLGELHETTFIDYLRITFQHAGFSGADDLDDVESFQAYLHRVRPKMLPI